MPKIQISNAAKVYLRKQAVKNGFRTIKQALDHKLKIKAGETILEQDPLKKDSKSVLEKAKDIAGIGKSELIEQAEKDL